MEMINKMNIYQKLIEVRKSVPSLTKEAKGYQFSYVSSSQVLTALREKMNEVGLILVPTVTDTKVETSTNDRGKSKYFTELTMMYRWVNADDPKEFIECPWYGQGLDTEGEKGVGKALTYAEKYFMLKFFNIPTDKDDPDSSQEKGDDPTIKPPPPKQQPKPPQEPDKSVVLFNSLLKAQENISTIQELNDHAAYIKENQSKLNAAQLTSLRTGYNKIKSRLENVDGTEKLNAELAKLLIDKPEAFNKVVVPELAKLKSKSTTGCSIAQLSLIIAKVKEF